MSTFIYLISHTHTGSSSMIYRSSTLDHLGCILVLKRGTFIPPLMSRVFEPTITNIHFRLATCMRGPTPWRRYGKKILFTSTKFEKIQQRVLQSWSIQTRGQQTIFPSKSKSLVLSRAKRVKLCSEEIPMVSLTCFIMGVWVGPPYCGHFQLHVQIQPLDPIENRLF